MHCIFVSTVNQANDIIINMDRIRQGWNRVEDPKARHAAYGVGGPEVDESSSSEEPEDGEQPPVLLSLPI